MRPLNTIPSAALAAALLAFMPGAGAALAPPAAGPDDASGAGALRARFGELRGELERSPFGRPLWLASRDGDHVLRGDVYAVLDEPFARVEGAFRDAAQWCDVLVLPFNTKRCEAQPRADASRLSIFIAKRKDSGPDDTYRIDFRYRAQAAQRDYMRAALRADSGPLGTHDYRIALEAAAAPDGHALLHLSYSYAYGVMSQVAMRAYLATAGADKVGFSVEGRDGDGRPGLVGGMRGVMERNTMRYFLAVEAYLQSLRAPPQAREERRLEAWFDATERFPKQLHEMDRRQYLAMKHRELDAGRGCCPVAAGS